MSDSAILRDLLAEVKMLKYLIAKQSKDDLAAAFTKACLNGDFDSAERLLTIDDVRFHSNTKTGVQPIHELAGQENSTDSTTIAINKFFNTTSGPNSPNSVYCCINQDKQTPLHLAAKAGNLATVAELASKMSPSTIDYEDKHGRTALWYAITSSRAMAVCETIIREGGDPNAGREPPIVHAVEANDADAWLIENMIKKGMKASGGDDYSLTPPICHAAENGHKSVLQALLTDQSLKSSGAINATGDYSSANAVTLAAQLLNRLSRRGNADEGDNNWNVLKSMIESLLECGCAVQEDKFYRMSSIKEKIIDPWKKAH